jgi:hypothetical protein
MNGEAQLRAWHRAIDRSGMACPVATSAARMNSSQNSDSSDSSRTVPIFEQNSFRDRAWQALR